MTDLRVFPVEGIPEIEPGHDVGALIVEHAASLESGDVVVVTQKIISKAEGRLVPAARREAAVWSETARVLRRLRGSLIAQTRQGFVCANAGVDASNVAGDMVALLPLDPDLSARRIRARLAHLARVEVGVVVSDTFGRAWRLGQTDVAIGLAGFDPFMDLRGSVDATGRSLTATRICIADEIAAAAELVMGKTKRIPAAIVRGAPIAPAPGAAAVHIVRPAREDLFR